MPKTKKRAQSSYVKKTLVPPTGSTFVNHGTCRPGVCNIGGFKDEKYFMNGHKKPHATFGKPRGQYRSSKNRDFCYQSLPHVDQRRKQKFKPSVPKFTEQPIQGLSSNENFIKANQKNVKRLQPKKLRNNFLYKKKQNYGKVPNYLNKIKENIQEEIDYIRNMKQQEENAKQTKRLLSQQEIQQIRQKLQEKYKEINKQYEKIAHLNRIDCLAIRKKKIFWEKQLTQIEKDMKVMNKDVIYVDLTC